MKKYIPFTFRYTLPIFCFFLTTMIHAQIQPLRYNWANGIGGASNDAEISDIVVDASENVYVLGQFQGTVDFDPSGGTANLTSTGLDDIFFAKYNNNGDYIWAKKIGGAGEDSGQNIKIDAYGNIYLTGSFSNSSVDFDPSGSTANLTSTGAEDIFFAKYDNNGNYIWAKQIGGTNSDIGVELCLDWIGNIYLTGVFETTVDFDPNGGTANLTSTGAEDIFFAKYDNNGNYIWAKSIGGTTEDVVTAIALDVNNNICLTGYFSNTVDFNPDGATVNLTSNGNDDIFLAKYNNNGNYIWARHIGGSGGDESTDLALDNFGNLYLTGYFGGTVDFDPSASIQNRTSISSEDIFLAKYAPNGSYIWAHGFPSSGDNEGRSIALDAFNNVYMMGELSGATDLDPSAGSASLTPISTDIYLAKYNTHGKYMYAYLIGGTGSDEGQAIELGKNNSVHVIGSFENTVDFDFNGGTANLISSGSQDIFMAKYNFGFEITSISPVQNAIHTPQDTDIFVEFTTALNKPDLNFTSIRISGNQTGFYTAGSFATVANKPHFLTIDLDHDFKAGEEITIGFTTGLRGATGEVFASAWQYQFTVKIPRLANINFITFSSVSTISQDTQAGYAFDADRDGDLDMAIVHHGASNQVGILLNDGTGKYNYSTGSPLSVGISPYSVYAFDADANGTMDVVVSNVASGSVSVLTSSGANIQGSPHATGGATPHGVYPFDMDGDGDKDLIIANAFSDNVGILKNNGLGDYKSAVGSPFSVGNNPIAVCTYDEDKDGDLDFVVANSDDNNVSIYHNDGTGNFILAYIVPVGTDPRDVYAFDADSDGDMDLIVVNETGINTVSYLENNGSGYNTAVHYSIGTNPYEISVADMDGDGDLDAIVPNKGDGTVSFLENSGSGSFTVQTVITGLDNPTSAIPVDVSGDGDLDLVVTETGTTKQMVVYESVAPINVVNITPTHKALHVPETADIFVEFTTALNVDNLNFASIQVAGTRSGAFSGTMTLSSGEPKFMTIHVTNGFKAGEFVSVTFTTAAKGARGEEFISSYTSFFTVQFLTGTVYVDKDALGGDNDGSSWANAFMSVNDALKFSTSGAEIWIAEGEYKPTGAGGNRTISFEMKTGVSLYGGFKGLNGTPSETTRNQRNPKVNFTTLSGDLNGDDDFQVSGKPMAGASDFQNYGLDNSYHVVFATTNTNNVTIDGLTIQGGYAGGSNHYNNGAGLYVQDASITVQSCILKQNYAEEHGGAAKIIDSQVLFSSVRISQNHAELGGGIISDNSLIRIKNGIFKYNVAFSILGAYGGAMRISGNSSTNIRIDNTLFYDNYAHNYGGGISIYAISGKSVVFANCIFDKNHAAGLSGGYGGGIELFDATNVSILNNTIINNRASGAAGKGGGISIQSSDCTIKNTLFYGNKVTGSDKSVFANGGTNTVEHSLFEETTLPTNLTNGGNNLFGQDPLFEDLTKNYQLTQCSPTRNAGDNSHLPIDDIDLDNDNNIGERIPLDFTSASRIFDDADDIVDIGAIEFQTIPSFSTVFVKAGSSGANNGKNWGDAYTDFQSALRYACDGSIIWVAQGTYRPSADIYENYTSSDKQKTFKLRDRIKVYGGFKGDETAFNQRILGGYETILSGDLGMDDSFNNNTTKANASSFTAKGYDTKNVYHVLFATANISNVELDGFTIKGGYANGSGIHDQGAGLYASDAFLTINNCIFKQNIASQYGGGIHATNANLVFNSVRFIQNHSSDYGGGLLAENSTIRLKNGFFRYNYADDYSGGAHFSGGTFTSVRIDNTLFKQNYVEQENGGGVSLTGTGVKATFVNTIFDGNRTNGTRGTGYGYGGGLYAKNNANLLVLNATLVDNRALGGDQKGGGIATSNAFLTVQNSIFHKNVAASAGKSIYVSGGSSDINYNLIQETNATLGGGNLIGEDPIFANTGTNYELTECSLARNAGNNSALITDILDLNINGNTNEDISVDFLTAPRIFDGTIDMGATEYQSTITSDIIYVNSNATSGGNGKNWASAYTDLQDALKSACVGDQIWIAKGIYKPTTSTNTNISFEPKDGVKIYGGFDGTEGSLAERNYITNKTILSGDLGSGLNSHNVVKINSTVTNATLLDGLTIAYGKDTALGGGGIIINGGGLTVKNCFISANKGNKGGGVLYNHTVSNPAGRTRYFVNTRFTYNHTSSYGGAVSNAGLHTEFINCIFDNNTTNQKGGAIQHSGGFITVTNSTFYNNNALLGGGAIYNHSGSNITIRNSIFNQNTRALTTTNDIENNASFLTVGNSLFNSINSYDDNGNNIQNEDPLFTDAPNGNFSLFGCSPAIDKGNNTFITISQDFQTAPRVFNSIVDMGAVERLTLNTPKRIYVDKTATGRNNGKSWTDAYLDFQSALKYSCSGDTIWVAKGVYYPTSGADRSISFVLRDGVKMYGGFAGGETSSSQRNFRINPTILSGDIGSNTSSFVSVNKYPNFITIEFHTNHNDNSYHVVSANGVSSSTVLDGFTISHGNTIGKGADSQGAGFRNVNGSPIIRNTTFRYNQATDGAATANIVSDGTTKSPQFINCKFHHNKATNGSGAILNTFVGTNSKIDLKLVNSVFAGNYARHSGGAISAVTITNNTIFMSVTNCTFFRNRAYSADGGAFRLKAQNAGAIVETNIQNTVFWANKATGTGHDINNTDNAKLFLSYNLYELANVTGVNITADAITNKTGNPNFLTINATGLSPQQPSPVLDAGNNALVTESHDLAGAPRILNGTVDMGAYESASAEIDLKQNTTFISVNDTFDLGITDIGDSIIKTFTITNTGISNLNFSGDLQISSTSEFTTNGSVSGALVPNASTTFNVIFKPTSTGQKETFLTIFSDDGNESVYTFRVVGETPFPGNHLSFDGNDDQIQSINHVGISGTTPRSLEIWTKFNSTSTSPMDIINWGNPTSNNAFGLQIVGQNLHFYQGNTSSINTNFQPNPHQWHHFALTYDGTTVKVYVDGSPIFAQNISSSVTDAKLNIGSSLDAEVDEVRVWNKALSQSDIQTKMNQRLDPSAEPHLLLYYTFDQGTPNADNTDITQVIDQTNNQNHGTLKHFAQTGRTSNWVGHPKLKVTSSTGQTLNTKQQINLGTFVGGNSKVYPVIWNNIGKNGDLKISDIQISGSAAFTTTSPSFITSVAPSSSQSFNLIFNTAQNGTFFVTVSFRSNDLFSSEFFLTVQGTISTAPDLAFLYENQELVTENTFNYGSTIVGASKVREFKIQNQGYENLILSYPHNSSTNAVRIEGTNQNDFVITQYPSDTTLLAQYQTSLKVAFTPKASGKRRAQLTIYSNSGTNNAPFILNLVGEGVCSEITQVRTNAPTSCQVPNGQIIFQLTNFVTTALYNIEMNQDSITNYVNIPINQNGELIIENIANGFSLKDVRISQVFSECVMTRSNLNLFLTIPPIKDTDVQVTTNITEISPKFPVQFTFTNLKDSLYYQLYNAQTNELLKDSLASSNSSITLDSLTTNFTFYLKAIHKNTACDILIQKSYFPKIEVYSSIREAQRNILQEFYNSTGGNQEWIPKWDFSSLEIADLEGVEVFAGNVIGIDVAGFGLIDKIPRSILDLPKLEHLNVSENKLSFGSLEDIAHTEDVEFTYINQTKVGLVEEVKINEGDTLRLEVKTNGSQNTYQWFREGIPIEDANGAVYLVNTSQLTDAGEYYVEIYNKIATKETIESHPITVTVFPKMADIDISPLEIFFEELGGNFWKMPWDFENVSLYRQHGLEVIAEGNQIYVLSINMPNNNLVGEIPDIFEHEMFSRLRFVNLSGNKLTGTIPISITDLKTITYLDLSDNLYSGEIPATIGQMIHLKALFLSHNNFSSLPDAVFQNLTKLETLFLNHNRLKTLPDAMGQLTHLRTLHLSDNFLATLPSSLENLTELRYLNLSHNRLITIPNYITTFTQLEELHIVHNFLYQLPSGLMDLPLKRLTIFNNALDHADLEPIITYFLSGRTEENIDILYAPQAKIGQEQEYFLETGTNFTLNIETPGEANNYQWYKNGNPIHTSGGQHKSITLRNISEKDAGQYTVLVSNTINTKLVLQSYVYQVSIGCGNHIKATITTNALREVCQGENANVLLCAKNTEGYQINWLKDEIKIVGAITPNWNAKEAGTYSFVLVDASGCTTNSTNEVVIIENPLPRGNIINQHDTLRLETDDSISNYQWFLNGLPIPEANTSTFLARKKGHYQVELTSVRGCRGLSTPLNVQISALENEKPITKIKIYPNPAQAQLHAKIPTKYRHQSALIEILDINGRLMSGKTEILGSEVKINLAGLTKGHYFLKISTNTQILIQEFIKEN